NAGQIATLSYDNFNETRQYNALQQLIRQTATNNTGTVMDMQYNYSATQNNGRILSSTDGVLNETTSYNYDSLNRLTAASSPNYSQQYTYDGFGNLTGTQNVIAWTFDPSRNAPANSVDANGNSVGIAPYYAYGYDVENRLITGFNTGGYPTNFGYDPWGKRVYEYGADGQHSVITVYSITGQRIQRVNRVSDDNGNVTLSAAGGENVYFGGKLIRSQGSTVATDRLGSVRGNSNGEHMAYLPYGQERTAPKTSDTREKFGTYFRDDSSLTGLDYANQRYYSDQAGYGLSVPVGRFSTPDPLGLRGARLGNPTTWNRYAYANDDPVNLFDPSGLFALPAGVYEDGDPPTTVDICMVAPDYPGCVGWDPFGDGTGSTGSDSDARAVDASTNGNARGLLKTRLQGFKSSNCASVLGHEGVNVQNILDNYQNEDFYDVRSGSAYANLTESAIGISSSSTAPLSQTLGSSDAVVVGTLGSSSTTAVLLGTQYFFSGNTDAIRMNSLLHEMLHALGGFTDSKIMNDAYFLKNGLVNKGYNDTSGISDWLSRDCKK